MSSLYSESDDGFKCLFIWLGRITHPGSVAVNKQNYRNERAEGQWYTPTSPVHRVPGHNVLFCVCVVETKNIFDAFLNVDLETKLFVKVLSVV